MSSHRAGWSLVLAGVVLASQGYAADTSSPAPATAPSPSPAPATAPAAGRAIPSQMLVPKQTFAQLLQRSWLAPEPSRVIYPERAAPSKLDHGVHAGKLGLDCISCHETIAKSTRSTDSNLPPPSACAGCHSGPTSVAMPVAPPPANLKFSHQLHGARGLACSRCHEVAKGGVSLPSMATCVGCHDGRAAPSGCTTCHLAQSDGTLQLFFASGKLYPTSALGGGVVHDLPFRTGHAKVARDSARLCASCHTRAYCDGCHNSSLRPLDFHGNDYLTLHVIDARKSPQSCQGCHRLQTFCLSCHERSGVGAATTELSPFRTGGPLSGGRSYHPPGWVEYDASSGQLLSVRGPNHHAFAAQRNLSACVSCHRESYCVGCHGQPAGPAGGLGFNPHGPAFARSCRALRDRNVRVCYRCHLPDDNLVANCQR